MLRLILMRLAASVPTLLAVVAVSFLLMRLAPGGPFDAERALDPAIAANLRHLYHLDRSIPEQFGFYLWSLLHGDLGPSTHWRDFTVNDLFARALPISLQIGAEAIGVALVVGLALGIAGAVRRDGVVARAIAALSLFGLAVPIFVVAPLLQLGFGLGLRWLPVGGWGDGAPRYQVLPVLTLALPQIAIIARLTEAAMRDALEAPHIRTLRAFGLPGWHIAIHALRGALPPVLSYLGPAAAALLTGSIVVETLFGIPGIGRYFVDGALARDYTLVMATVIVVGVMVVAFNLLVDIAYGLLDPRVRYDRGAP
jgi:oligopeptide transport system permease protein